MCCLDGPRQGTTHAVYEGEIQKRLLDYGDADFSGALAYAAFGWLVMRMAGAARCDRAG